MTPLSHALGYIALGWRVAPIPPGHKHPADLPRWQEQATTDVAQIRRWWPSTATQLGVSIVTGVQSGLFVVDVDPRHGGDETLADLVHQYGKLPATVECLTGGGGRHLYFAMPDGVVITNDAGRRLGPGLDVRGEGGQVVAPPTIHPTTGARYEWEASSDPLDGVQPAMPPAWLVELLAAPPTPLTPRRAQRTATALDLRPGDRFEAETEWADLLTADGWTLHSARRGVAGDYELWTRPGKDAREGASASLYYQGSDVLKVFTSSVPGLDADATYTRFGYVTATKYGGDHAAFGRELAQRYRPSADNQHSGIVNAPPSARPAIVHSGRLLDELTAEAIAALVAANTPPAYFVRAGQLARVRADEEERPLVEALVPGTARLALADAALWYRQNKDGERTASPPPLDVATSVLSRGTWPLPALAGVVELPVMRPDGTFATDHGYDPATRLYHWHRGEPYQPVPTTPTAAELADAVALVDEALADFPWDTTADRANAWGLLLTPLVRAVVGQVPMALVDAPEPGTGKGLLVTVAATIALGRPTGLMAWPSSEEELEKKITTVLLAGSTMIVWDNVEGMIRSGALAAALTADVWEGRVLGRSERVVMPNRATWVATGNNIDVGGDLARRCYRIRLDARQAQPWKRTGFRHPDLARWVADNRTRLLHALCTIVAGWHAAGRPLGSAASAMGGYTSWARTIGGILEVAGVRGFLANLDAFHADADQEARQWEAFLMHWSDREGESPVTTGELVTKVRDIQNGAAWREVLPEQLAGSVDAPSFSQKLGKALRARAGRHYGEDGIHVTELPRDRRQIAIWCVTTRSVRLFEDHEGVRPREWEHSRASKVSSTSDDAIDRGSRGSDPAHRELKNGSENSLLGVAGNTPATPALPRDSLPDDDLGLF